MTPALGYCRVSTGKQAENGLSLDVQERAIRAYAALYGLELVEVLVERGASGTSVKGRPEYQKLLARVQSTTLEQAGEGATRDFAAWPQGGVRAVVVYKLDRLFRSLRDALGFFDTLRASGCAFHSVQEKWDSNTPVGEFALNIMLAFSQMEARQASERTKSVLRAAKQPTEADALSRHRRRTGQLHMGKAPYGYGWLRRKLVPVAAEQTIAHAIRARHAEGLTINQIILWLDEAGFPPRNGKAWHRTQIGRILKADYLEEASA